MRDTARLRLTEPELRTIKRALLCYSGIPLNHGTRILDRIDAALDRIDAMRDPNEGLPTNASCWDAGTRSIRSAD
jgi:hypothetical protein